MVSSTRSPDTSSTWAAASRPRGLVPAFAHVGDDPLGDSPMSSRQWCPLRTSVGSMHGSYQMVTADGERFDAVIAPFTLAMPNALN